MKGHGSKFTDKMEAAITGLITQKNQEEVARSAGICIATLMRCATRPRVPEGVPRGPSTRARSSGCPAPACDERCRYDAVKGHGGPKYAAISQSAAADSVLGNSAKSIELEDLDARLTELQRSTEAPGQKHSDA